MPAAAVAKVSIEGVGIDEALSKFALGLRQGKLQLAIRAASKVVQKEAERRAPIGDPNDKPEIMPLNKGIRTKVIGYPNGNVLGIIGPSSDVQFGYPLERGHKKVVYGVRHEGEVAPVEFLKPAGEATQGLQRSVIIQKLRQYGQTYRA